MTKSAVLLLWLPCACLGWDYEGHRVVNQLALASLPANFPAFVRAPAAQERVAFLGGEADRWRNTPDLSLRHANGPDHFLDLDDLPLHGLDPKNLSPFRYEFLAHLALARERHPEHFPKVDPARDADRTRWLPGFLPWAITEHYAKLKSAFSYLKAYEEAGTPAEVANARESLLYVMGVMGHFVGDAAQPLHTTKHYNGWVGANPRGFTTNRTFHAWIDGRYLQKAGLDAKPLLARVRPAQVLSSPEGGMPTQVFPVVMRFIMDQFQLVEPLYEMEKSGKLSDSPVVPEAHEFLHAQLLKAGQMLGDLWLTAWKQAPPDTFLKAQLAKRQLQTGGK